MVREPLAERKIGETNSFRWRGGEVLRLEGFTDAVFGVSLTLLIVSLEVPRTFDELLIALRSVPAFAICFLIVVQIWYSHYLFFRRYGLQDVITNMLNALLLFIVLVYIYPLKFLFNLFTAQIFSALGAAGSGGGEATPVILDAHVPLLFVIFGLGFAGVYLIFTLFHLHAYRKREALALTPLERFDTRASIFKNLWMAAVGLASILIAIVGGGGLAGWIYFSIPLLNSLEGWYFGTHRRPLEITSSQG